MPTMKELGLDKLTDDERYALGHELLDSVPPPEPGAGLTDEKKAILLQRMADADANPDDWVPAEEVHARIRARLDRKRS